MSQAACWAVLAAAVLWWCSERIKLCMGARSTQVAALSSLMQLHVLCSGVGCEEVCGWAQPFHGWGGWWGPTATTESATVMMIVTDDRPWFWVNATVLLSGVVRARACRGHFQGKHANRMADGVLDLSLRYCCTGTCTGAVHVLVLSWWWKVTLKVSWQACVLVESRPAGRSLACNACDWVWMQRCC